MKCPDISSMIRIFFALVMWLLVAEVNLHGQVTPHVDSLKRALMKSETDEDRLQLYYLLFSEVNDSDSSELFTYGSKGIDLATALGHDSVEAHLRYELGWSMLMWGNLSEAKQQFQTLIDKSQDRLYERGIASGYKGLGDVLKAEARYVESLENYMRAVESWEKIGDKKGLGYCYNNIGVVYRIIADIPQALEYYLKAVELLEEINDARGIGYLSSNIGNIYYSREDYTKALQFHKKALSYNRELNDELGEVSTLNNIGIVFDEQGVTDLAMTNFRMSLDLSEKINYKEGALNALINMANAFLNIQEFDSAVFYFERARSQSYESSDQQSESYALIGLGSVYLEKGEYLKARKLIERSVELSTKIRYPNNVLMGTEKLAEIEAKLGNYERAFKAHIQFKILSDSLYNEEQTEKLVRIQAENEFKQERDSLTLAQQLERVMYEKDISQRKFQQLLLVIGLVLFAIVLVVIISYNRKLQRLNHAVTQQRDELDKLNRTKNRFFSIISHDLRGPMSMMTGYGDLIHFYLEKKYGVRRDQELDKISNHLKDASDQVLSLLDSLMQWALKEDGKLTLNPVKIDLKSCVDESFEVVKHQAMTKNIKLISEIEDHLTLLIDRNSLMTIIRNLLGNSLKFTPENGSITVKGTKSGRQTMLSVTDTGMGISREKMEHLFEINEKKVSKGTKGEKGTGLGLNLVHDFTTMNGGTISVRSAEGIGTTFEMVFKSSD